MPTSPADSNDSSAELHALRDHVHSILGLVQVLQTLELDEQAAGLVTLLEKSAAETVETLGRLLAVTSPQRNVGQHAAASDQTASSTDELTSHNSLEVTPPRLGDHVLVVDDSPVNRLLTTSQLEKLGYPAQEVGSGIECLELIEDELPALILLDWHMPEMDGLETARRLRRRQAEAGWPHLPVVALTARAMRGDRDMCIEAGMDDFLSKPVSLSQLGETIERWLPVKPPLSRSTPAVDSLSGLAVFDAGHMAALASDLDDEDAARSILQTFLQELPRTAKSLAESQARGDRTATLSIGHSLKSTSGMVGALLLQDAATRLEQQAGTDESLDDQIAQVLAIIERTSAEIEIQLSITDRDPATNRPPPRKDRE